MWQATPSIEEDVGVKQTVENARTRNRFRYRLLGMKIYAPYSKKGYSPLSQEEQVIISQINGLIDKLAKDWSENTAKLGFNVKPYVCSSCNKKSGKEHLMHVADYRYEGMQLKNFCLKCYNRYKKDE